MVGLLTSLFGYLYLRCKLRSFSVFIVLVTHISLVTHPAYNTNQQYTAPVVLISFLLGLSSCKWFEFLQTTFKHLGCVALSLSASLEAGVSTM